MGWDGIHVPPYMPERAWPGHRTLEGVVAGRVPRSRPRAGRCISRSFWSLLARLVLVALWEVCGGFAPAGLWARLWEAKMLVGLFGSPPM